MITLKVTEKIGKGEMSIPGVETTVTSGYIFSLSKKEYEHYSVQDAIDRGYLEIIGKEFEDSSKIILTNLTDAPVSIGDIVIPAGGSQGILEERFLNSDIQAAINAGWISSEKESNKKSAKINKKRTLPKDKNKDIVEEDIEKYSIDDDDPGTTMQSWSPHDKKNIDKDYSMKKVATDNNMSTHNSEKNVNEEGVMVGNIDFTEPSPEIEKKSKRKSKTIRSKKSSKKKKGLKPVGRVKKEPSADYIDFANNDEGSDIDFVYGGNDEDVDFVDIEQDLDAIKNHPDKRISGQNIEIDI